MERLTDSEIDARLATLGPAWHREGDTIVGELGVPGLRSGDRARQPDRAGRERADHHPDILIHRYRRLRLTLSTHSAGGLTENDFALAGRDRRAVAAIASARPALATAPRPRRRPCLLPLSAVSADGMNDEPPRSSGAAGRP